MVRRRFQHTENPSLTGREPLAAAIGVPRSQVDRSLEETPSFRKAVELRREELGKIAALGLDLSPPQKILAWPKKKALWATLPWR